MGLRLTYPPQEKKKVVVGGCEHMNCVSLTTPQNLSFSMMGKRAFQRQIAQSIKNKIKQNLKFALYEFSTIIATKSMSDTHVTCWVSNTTTSWKIIIIFFLFFIGSKFHLYLFTLHSFKLLFGYNYLRARRGIKHPWKSFLVIILSKLKHVVALDSVVVIPLIVFSSKRTAL